MQSNLGFCRCCCQACRCYLCSNWTNRRRRTNLEGNTVKTQLDVNWSMKHECIWSVKLFWCSAFKHWSREQCVSGRRRRGSRGGQQRALCVREWLSVAWRSPLIQFKHIRTEWITNRVMRSSGFNDGFETLQTLTNSWNALLTRFLCSLIQKQNHFIWPMIQCHYAAGTLGRV